MIQKEFAKKVTELVKEDPNVIGLAVGGSWITNELDEFSDLDLILVTTDKISTDKQKMIGYAERFGKLLSAFTGEHVGEPRLLICLYDEPLLHVDIKFLMIEELHSRIEDPVVLFERGGQLSAVISSTPANLLIPDYQWIEDRIWTWVHYTATKIGRGEYFDCLDALAFIRARVLAPLLQVKNKMLMRGVRRMELQLDAEDLKMLKSTVTGYDRNQIIYSLENTIKLYQSLRQVLFPSDIRLNEKAEKKSLAYFDNYKSI